MSVKESKTIGGISIGLRVQLLVGFCLFLAIILTSIFFITYYETKKEVLDVGGEVVTRSTKDIVGLMKLQDERVKRGEISLEQAQEEVRTYVLGPKLPDGNRDLSKSKMSLYKGDYMYVWASHPDGTLTMHPFPFEGVNAWDLQVNGKYTIRDSWSNPKKTGFVFNELWQNTGEPVYTFIAYQEYFEPWDWVVGSGGRQEVIYQQRLQKLMFLFLMSSVIALLIGALLAYFFTGRIVKPVSSLSELMSLAEKGDLSVQAQVKSGNEIGSLSRSFNNMLSGLRNVIGSVKKEADQLSRASDSLSLNSQQTASGATQTAATMSEMSCNVQEVVQNVQQMTEAFRSSSQMGEDGRKQIIQVKEQMASITKGFGDIKIAIEGLVDNSEKIGQITEVITGIAEQTNLLALNAAIEAARAGESGRGFAVVADEVRKLAEESVSAANEIKSLIASVQSSANVAENAVNTGAQGIDAGTSVIEEAGEVFSSIINSVQTLLGQVESIATATTQFDSAIENVAAATEEQTAAMEEVSSAAETLKAMASELKAITNQFNL